MKKLILLASLTVVCFSSSLSAEFIGIIPGDNRASNLGAAIGQGITNYQSSYNEAYNREYQKAFYKAYYKAIDEQNRYAKEILDAYCPVHHAYFIGFVVSTSLPDQTKNHLIYAMKTKLKAYREERLTKYYQSVNDEG
jgi:hypothetical protein